MRKLRESIARRKSAAPRTPYPPLRCVARPPGHKRSTVAGFAPRTRAYVRALTRFPAPLPRRVFLYLTPLRTSSAEDMRERTQSQRSPAVAPESAEALKSSAEAHKSSAEAHKTSAEFPAGAPSAEGEAKKQRFLRKLPRNGSSPLLGKKRIEHGRQKRTPRRTHAPFEAVQQLLTRRPQIRQRCCSVNSSRGEHLSPTYRRYRGIDSLDSPINV